MPDNSILSSATGQGSTYSSGQMPVLYVGHGSPINVIEEDETLRFFNDRAAAGSLTMISVRIG